MLTTVFLVCRYVMLIHTPRLCAERLFLEGRTDTVAPAAPIECQPVVRQLPKEIAGEEEGATSSVQKAATTEEDGVVRTEPDTPEEPAPLVAPGEEEMVQPEELDEHLNDDDDQEEHFFDDESYEEQETMLTLVYDPETGEIESAVTDSGEDVFLDSALRRMLFGDEDDADGTAEAESVQPQSGEEAQVHMEAEGGIPDLRQLVSLRACLTQFTHPRQDKKAYLSPNHRFTIPSRTRCGRMLLKVKRKVKEALQRPQQFRRTKQAQRRLSSRLRLLSCINRSTRSSNPSLRRCARPRSRRRRRRRTRPKRSQEPRRRRSSRSSDRHSSRDEIKVRRQSRSNRR